MNLPPWDHLKAKRWDVERISEYFNKLPWLVGCNYIPSYAINQLEMFQPATFNITRIEQELEWADNLGFNVLRVFVHYLLWESDSTNLKKLMDQFMKVCEKHHIKVLWVLFDDCWNQDPQIGKQPDPQPGIHNSGWVASPGRKRVLDSSCYPTNLAYVKELLERFKDDARILGWDLYNEPGNTTMELNSFPLLVKTFEAAREVNPNQPITTGIWKWLPFKLRLGKTWRTYFQFLSEVSDFVTFHNYAPPLILKAQIKDLLRYKRPLLCTEYMARKSRSLFQNCLPVFKEFHVGAMNWGFVDGKTQTKYPWGSKAGNVEPEPWFHEIFHTDGSPYRVEEVEFIRKLLH
jgi:hypothetical protein